MFPISMHFWLGDEEMMRAFCEAGFNAVHYNSELVGRSNQFRDPFLADSKLFDQILEDIEVTVRQEYKSPHLRVGDVAISAFSAGYAAVREILKNPTHFMRIKTLIMADTIYADFVSNEVRVPVIEQMVDFMRFAQAAAQGEKTMIVTHIDYDCDHAGYCSTRRTADMLLAAVGGRRRTPTESIGTSRPVTDCFDLGNFHLLHFNDRNHMYHRSLIMELWRIYGLGKVSFKSTTETA
jgi:hypothetical protein